MTGEWGGGAGCGVQNEPIKLRLAGGAQDGPGGLSGAAGEFPFGLWPVFGTLLAASALSVGLVLLRVVVSGQPEFLSLAWNLFLAWVPLVLAGAAYRVCRKPSAQGWFRTYVSLWLIFLPNAPYIVTDLIHLQPRPPVPIWMDMMIIVSFAGIGLLLGFLALYLMQRLVAERFGSGRSWMFALGVFMLTGLGIYVGRFLRYNSWDLFLRPLSLGRDVLQTFAHPVANPAPFFYAGLFSGLFLVVYLMLYSLTWLRASEPGR